MKLTFLHTKKPRQFGYKPVFYNPAKEAEENRKKDMGLIPETDPKDKLRRQMREKWKLSKSKTGIFGSGSNRILIYILLALALLYFIFGW
ncbi:MAG: hypothetical protein Q7J34_04705 [Bacteroidales bacterium]|jgi:hypothetical protein|nr:hypothetical protein [Bacteroidales bacterium]